MRQLRIVLLIVLLYVVQNSFAQRVVRYDLYIADTLVNYTGKTTHAIAINGSIPAPELHFTEGDTAAIYVHNTLKTETSLHWHGLILPNRYDGVPYLTSAPIKAGETHLYKFPLLQNGTYWYHSHTKLQEQAGMYGAFIVHKNHTENMKEYTLLLSDWTNEKPYEVHRKLHNANDWYAIKKKSTQNYFQAIKEGYFKTKLINEWKRMLAMDVSDVYYDRFLSNGQQSLSTGSFKAGDKIKLRIINGSASTYFWLNYAGGKITTIASDGKDVIPVTTNRLLIAVAETYDVIITIPATDASYEFRATAEDRSGYTSLFIGAGNRIYSSTLPRLNYFEGMRMMNGMMKMNGEMDAMGMPMTNQTMDMNTVMYPEVLGEGEQLTTLNYGMLRAADKTTLPEAPTKILHFNLSGNMNRYVWSIGNKVVSEVDKICIKKGENVRIVLYNGTMMRHPMHLHGHFFRVLNGEGDYSPLKNVLDIMPMETDTIEFAATESGDWFFHCHILYHMMSGMGRIFTYDNSPANPELPDPKKALRKLYRDDRMFHPMFNIGIESSGSDGEFMLANTRWKLQTEWRLGLDRQMGYELESHIGRYFGKNQFLFPYLGYDFRFREMHETEKNIFQQINTKNNRYELCAGVQYTLPLLIIADARVDMSGNVRFQLMREDLPLTSRLRLNGMINSDLEYMLGLRYIITSHFSFSSHYDSDMGIGAGITFSY